MFNVSAVGHLVADPEEREVREDLKLTKFRILINKKKGQEEVVSAIDCNLWGDKGNAAMKYLKKGDQVTIAGAAHLNQYEKQNGESGCSVEVNVQEYSLPPKPRVEEMPF